MTKRIAVIKVNLRVLFYPYYIPVTGRGVHLRCSALGSECLEPIGLGLRV